MEFLPTNVPSEKVLFASVIRDAANNYLYAFLGKNGISAEEFFSAYQYFFEVVSDKVAYLTVKQRTIKNTFTIRGQKKTENRCLSDNELMMMCFDKHYEMSGLSDYFHIDKFRAKLKDRRREVLSRPENWKKAQEYVHSLYEHELSMIANGNQVPIKLWEEDLLETLVAPLTPFHLASLIYVPSKYKRPKKTKLSKAQEISPSLELAKKISEEKPPLGEDWGPLSTLSGDKNVEVDSNTSSSNLCGSVTGISPTAQTSDGGEVALEN